MCSTQIQEIAAQGTNKLFKIVCIHGYRQNADIFRQKTGSLRKTLKGIADFRYISAPNLIPSEIQIVEDGEEKNQRAWWFTNANKTFESKKPSDICIGFEESLSVIKEIFNEEGPFDGLIGFSQGATFVSILCAMESEQTLKLGFKFAIIVAGFKSLVAQHEIYYKSVINIPTLHIYGETDGIIPKELSEALKDCFKNPKITMHSGGHYVPATKLQKTHYVNFLKTQEMN